MTSMNDHTEVLFANDAFYIAFTSRDFDAMDQVWASDGPVTCIHPGWGALLTRQEVMVSWSAILSNDDAPDISFHHPSVHFSGTTAIVIGYEQVGDATLIATNVFVREADGWKLSHHQSGASPPPEEDEDEDEDGEEMPNRLQ